MKNSKDLTEGSILKQIIIFSFPILISQLLQTFYNTIDAITVGKGVGTVALAAVTASSDISQLIIGFFSGLSNGAGTVTAKLFGAKNEDNLNKAIHTTVLFGLILGVSMTVIGITIAPYLLHIIDCPSDVYSSALTYLRIYLFGIQFTALYNVASSILRSLGDSKSPFIFLSISSFMNIVLDYLFVIIFKLGVNGVGYATIISQILSVILIYGKMFTTKDIYKLNISCFKIDKKLLIQVIKSGIPSAIQGSLINLSNLFIQRNINSFGSSAMAGIGASKKIDKFIVAIASAVSYACSTFVSQNTGAKKYERIKKGILACLLIAFVPTILITIFIYFNKHFVISMFISDENAIYYGMQIMSYTMPFYLLHTIYHIMSYVIRGFGHSTSAMCLTISGLIVIRQVYINIALSLNNVIEVIYISYPFGWGVTSLLCILYYFIIIRRRLLPVEEKC